jgi:hypothetical protein
MCDDPPLTNWCDITCEHKKHKKVAKIDGWASLPEDEDDIAKILAKHGPMSVAIDASGGGMGFLFPWLKSYKKGVANPKNCPEDALDHAVLLVGFGEDSGQKYWLIKNSWGSKFGENGYFRLLRGVGCGGAGGIGVGGYGESMMAVEAHVFTPHLPTPRRRRK